MTTKQPARLRVILEYLNQAIRLLPHFNDTLRLPIDDAAQAREKFLQEVALFLLIAKRTAHQVPDALDVGFLGRTLQGLATAFDLPKFVDTIKAFPQAALAFGPLAAALDLYGEPNHPVSRAVREATASIWYLAAERKPFRQLEALWLRNVIRHEAHSLDDMMRASIVARRTHPCFMLLTDAYAKTHCAMYLTDFGALPRLEGVDQDALKADFDHDLAWTFACADWDLIGEVIVAGRYCLDTLSPWHRVCEAALDAVFDKFGFLPTRTLDLQYLSSLAGDRQETYRLFHSYHTNVVYGLGLLSQLTRQKVNDEAPVATPVGIDNPFQILNEIGVSLNLVGSGFDRNWYDESFNDINIDWDFMTDGLLIRVFRDEGVDCARRFMGASAVPPLQSRLAQTWHILQRHVRLIDQITLS